MKTLLTKKIKFNKYKNIVILTGVGISVASGLKTYRGKTSNQDNNIGNKAHVAFSFHYCLFTIAYSLLPIGDKLRNSASCQMQSD